MSLQGAPFNPQHWGDRESVQRGGGLPGLPSQAAHQQTHAPEPLMRGGGGELASCLPSLQPLRPPSREVPAWKLCSAGCKLFVTFK